MSALTTSPWRELFVLALLAVAMGISSIVGSDAEDEDDDLCPTCGSETMVEDDGLLSCCWCEWTRPRAEVLP